MTKVIMSLIGLFQEGRNHTPVGFFSNVEINQID